MKMANRKSLKEKLWKKFKKPLRSLEFKSDEIRRMKNPSEEIQLAAIRKNADNIKWIMNPTENVQLETLKLAGRFNIYIFSMIRNPTIEVQKFAIRQSDYNLDIMRMCPDIDQFVREIEDEMIIKDIIE